MSRELTPKTQLDTLRKEAKRWRKALQAGDAAALERLQAIWPDAPKKPRLRDMHHALATEYGCESWIALRAKLEEQALARKSRAERITILMHHGWDGNVGLARRIVERDPLLARVNLHLAAMCGDVAAVERHIVADPDAVNAPHGDLGWTALACTTYGRIDATNAVTIARLLLDAGADPNFQFDDGWSNPFKVLTGAIRLGEGARPSHPQAEELVELLIAEGASPYDTQALYNASIVGDDVHWYETLWRHCQAQGLEDSWREPDFFKCKDGSWLSMLDYLLGNAVGQNHLVRAQWLLERGADATARDGYTLRSLPMIAELSGYTRLAEMLEAHGAPKAMLAGAEAFQAAVLRGDHAAARALAEADSGLGRDPDMLLKASELGNAHAVALLLELGASPRSADGEGITPLHRAVQSGSLDTARLLVEAGAEIDAREHRWHGTPMSWALVLHKPAVAHYLLPSTRDVRALAHIAAFSRLEEVLASDPGLANQVLLGVEAPTPLFCLADDPHAGLAVARILLAHGADPSLKDAEGRNAIDAALSRELDEAAELMEEWLGA